MAALTWRNVDLPNFDLRGLAVASNGVSDAFSRMGQMLIDRETSLRNEATKAATAKLLMAGSPEELEALRQQGTAGLDRRVDLGAYGQALTNQRGILQEQAIGKEDLLNKRAAAMFGDEYADMMVAAARGDQDAITAVNQKAAADPLWGRVAGLYMKDVTSTLGDTQTRGETSRHNRADEADARAGRAIQSRQTAIAEQARAEQHATYLREGKDREDQAAGVGFGERYLDDLAKRNPAAVTSAAFLLERLPQYRNASPKVREGMLAGIKGRSGELLQDTPINTDTPAADWVRNEVAQGKANTNIVNTLVNEQLVQNNPGLAIMRAAQDPKYQNVTIDQVIDRYKKTGIVDAAQWIERAQAKGIPLSRLMAAPDVVDMSNRDWSPERFVHSFYGGGGAVGAGEFGSNLYGFDLRSGTTRANAGIDSLVAMQDPGSLAAAQQDLDNKLGPTQATQAKLEAAEKRANVERQLNNGNVSPETLLELRVLRRKLEQDVAGARGKNLKK